MRARARYTVVFRSVASIMEQFFYPPPASRSWRMLVVGGRSSRPPARWCSCGRRCCPRARSKTWHGTPPVAGANRTICVCVFTPVLEADLRAATDCPFSLLVRLFHAQSRVLSQAHHKAGGCSYACARQVRSYCARAVAPVGTGTLWCVLSGHCTLDVTST